VRTSFFFQSFFFPFFSERLFFRAKTLGKKIGENKKKPSRHLVAGVVVVVVADVQRLQSQQPIQVQHHQQAGVVVGISLATLYTPVHKLFAQRVPSSSNSRGAWRWSSSL